MEAISEIAKPKLALLLSEDWFFLSHFRDRAIAARDAGYDVTILANDNGHGDEIRKVGLSYAPVPFRRGSLNPLAETGTVHHILGLYRTLKPDIVHQVALKPILYGSIAARFARVPHVINAPVGMGYVFTSESVRARVLRPALALGLRTLLNPVGSRVVFENRDDKAEAIRRFGVRDADTALIRGAGVDLDAFAPAAKPETPVTVVLVARMLWDKGVGEYVAAARALRGRARFLLVGPSDAQNHAAIPEDQLHAWSDEGAVEWTGARSDIPQILAGAHIFCLPSYREGLPKSVLEAMAAGLPVVSTDVPGCREAVVDGETGILVPARDSPKLTTALARLIDDPAARERLGRAGRQRAEAEFSTQIVTRQTLALYDAILAQTGR